MHVVFNRFVPRSWSEQSVWFTWYNLEKLGVNKEQGSFQIPCDQASKFQLVDVEAIQVQRAPRFGSCCSFGNSTREEQVCFPARSINLVQQARFLPCMNPLKKPRVVRAGFLLKIEQLLDCRGREKASRRNSRSERGAEVPRFSDALPCACQVCANSLGSTLRSPGIHCATARSPTYFEESCTAHHSYSANPALPTSFLHIFPSDARRCCFVLCVWCAVFCLRCLCCACLLRSSGVCW